MIYQYTLPKQSESNVFKSVNNLGFDALADNVKDVWTKSKDGLDTYYAAAAFSAAFSKVSEKRKHIVKEVDSRKDNYLLQTIVDQITQDALAPEMGTGKIIDVRIKNNEKAQKVIDNLNETIDIDQFIQDITPNLISYGEYTVQNLFDLSEEEKSQFDILNDSKSKKQNKTQKQKKYDKGVTDIIDNITPGSVIPVPKNGKVAYYIVRNREGKLVKREKSDFTHFTMGGSRVKIPLNEALGHTANQSDDAKEVMKHLPRYIKTGKSLIYHILEKIKDLELLEKLIPATKISKLSAGNIVGVNLPEKTEINVAKKTAKQLENMINRQLAVSKDQEITVTDILNTSGRTKVIPLFGEKGSLEKFDYKSDEPDDLISSVEEIRRVICSAIGIPYEILFSADSPNKQEILRRYSRYLRKLKHIRTAIVTGIKELVITHLANSDVDFKKEEISVQFLNNLVEVDNLDKLEHADITVSTLGNIYEFLSRNVFEGPLKNYTKISVIADYFERNLQTIGLSGLFDIDKLRDDEGDDTYFNKFQDDEGDF